MPKISKTRANAGNAMHETSTAVAEATKKVDDNVTGNKKTKLNYPFYYRIDVVNSPTTDPPAEPSQRLVFKSYTRRRFNPLKARWLILNKAERLAADESITQNGKYCIQIYLVDNLKHNEYLISDSRGLTPEIKNTLETELDLLWPFVVNTDDWLTVTAPEDNGKKYSILISRPSSGDVLPLRMMYYLLTRDASMAIDQEITNCDDTEKDGKIDAA